MTDLVCCHLSPGHEAEESLLRVNISLGRGPGGRVGGVPHAPVLDVLPLGGQGDGVLTRPPQHPLRHHTRAGHPSHRDAPSHALETNPSVEKILNYDVIFTSMAQTWRSM